MLRRSVPRRRPSTRAAAMLVVASSLVSCASRADRGSESAPVIRPTRSFSFVGPDGGRVSSASTRGRVTIVLFATTYDLPSQLMARQIGTFVRSQRPRLNAAAVILEPPTYAPLADTFRASLELPYPVVMADRATLGGHGTFGSIRGVPSLVILDADGREVRRYEGVISVETLREGVAAARPEK